MNLVVVAHPDDEILGFGGSGQAFIKKGEKVQPVILCGDVEVRENRPDLVELKNNIHRANSILDFEKPILGGFPNIRMNNVDHYEIVKFIESQIIKYEPKRIFTHHPSDLNDDHVIISKACQVASRIFQRKNIISPIKLIALMEIISSTDWSYGKQSNNFNPNYFINIEPYIDNKVKSLFEYKNVMRPQPHPRSESNLRALATYRGSQSSNIYAEAFELIYMTDF